MTDDTPTPEERVAAIARVLWDRCPIVTPEACRDIAASIAVNVDVREAEIATLRQERDQAMRSADAMTKAGRVAIDAINVLRGAKEAAEAENARLRAAISNLQAKWLIESDRPTVGEGDYDTGQVDALKVCASELQALLAPPAETNHE